MATLQKIRNKAGVLIAIIIGLALFAFVLSDFLQSGSSMFGDSQNEIAKIEGESVTFDEYQYKLDVLTENYKRNTKSGDPDESTVEMLRDQTWDQLIREKLLLEQYKELGLGVSPDELFDMVQGNNIDPQIQQISIFKNEMGMFDRSLVIRYLKALEQAPDQKIAWIAFEQDLMKQKVSNKYNTLIKKGYYVTSFQANLEADSRKKVVNIEYVVQRYTAVPDEEITVSEADIAAYYTKHKSEYKQEASRDFDYITFDILPTEDDTNTANTWINNIKPEFAEADEDIQFVNMNSDAGFNDVFYKKGELPYLLDSILFNAPIDTIYGPYLENGSFKLTKLIEARNLPDTVKASHILITPEKTNGDLAKAQSMIDSLKTLVETGVPFELLAMKHGSDGTTEKGGDLGWFKRQDMVPPFNDSCFFSPKGHLTSCVTQFGVHLILVTDKGEEVKKVKVATIERKIEPSDATYDMVYAEASKFAGTNNNRDKFEKSIVEAKMSKKVASNILENDNKIAGLDSPRPIVRWAYTSDKNDVSPVYQLGDRYIIAALVEVREKGIAPMDQVRTEIEVNVRKEKKADKLFANLNEKLASIKELEELARSIKDEVKTADNINFSLNSIPGLGIEPAVLAYSVNMEENKISEPIKGNNGVYVIRVTSMKLEERENNIQQERSVLERSFHNNVDYQVYEAIKASADITDKRSKFY